MWLPGLLSLPALLAQGGVRTWGSVVCRGGLSDGGCAGGERPTGVEVMQPCAHPSLLAAGSGDGA